MQLARLRKHVACSRPRAQTLARVVRRPAALPSCRSAMCGDLCSCRCSRLRQAHLQVCARTLPCLHIMARLCVRGNERMLQVRHPCHLTSLARAQVRRPAECLLSRAHRHNFRAHHHGLRIVRCSQAGCKRRSLRSCRHQRMSRATARSARSRGHSKRRGHCQPT